MTCTGQRARATAFLGRVEASARTAVRVHRRRYWPALSAVEFPFEHNVFPYQLVVR